DGFFVTASVIFFFKQKTAYEIKLSKFNLETGHVALAEPFDVSTDFELSAKQPELNIAAKIQGNFMADPEQKHFVAKGLDASVQGDLAGGKGVVVKLSGDVDAKPETMEFLVDGLKLAMTGDFDGAKVAVDLAAPALVVQEDEVS